MVSVRTFVILALSSGALAAVDFAWTACTNAQRCTKTDPPAEGPGLRSTGFRFQASDGYWYSTDADGLYVSPTGYFMPGHDYNIAAVGSKDDKIGWTRWAAPNAQACCLPDGVGNNIKTLAASKY
ncbi:hypothetical protein Cob_v012647 [Colletotrichum orbiculare MAFF 240422]|uniref:Uncharacterized protein n=1 Tax=Colletotrichum orbiculare (strain 104-T / ATCC 96160 / CBS 514.97 / LARS 414 / MAFF 240422) TaxID=1213857 RepID=N4VR31_COLOR|nr:hypothetical protein Cob_v012647 [Colletotrichum orbiculare MAFF 240422]